MPNTFLNAQNGDIDAFADIYSEIYTRLYYLAYHSLANKEEAIDAVKTAVKEAYSNIRSCKSVEQFNGLMLKKLCDRIIRQYREYRKNQPMYDANPTYIKSVMRRLTES